MISGMTNTEPSLPNVFIQLQTMTSGTDHYLGVKFALGTIELNVALNLAALDSLLENLPEGRAALKREMVGLVVPQQAAAPKLYTKDN